MVDGNADHTQLLVHELSWNFHVGQALLRGRVLGKEGISSFGLPLDLVRGMRLEMALKRETFARLRSLARPGLQISYNHEQRAISHFLACPKLDFPSRRENCHRQCHCRPSQT